jgi:DNA-binding NarL/FixJ family response regulator
VLALYLRAGNLRMVAMELGLSVNTVRAQRLSIMRKLGTTSQIELTKEAIKRGLIDLREGK